MTDVHLPPLCPVCSGNTTLKEMHRSQRDGKMTCFFRCVDCGTDYPRSIAVDDVRLAALMGPSWPGKSQRRDNEGDPAN